MEFKVGDKLEYNLNDTIVEIVDINKNGNYRIKWGNFDAMYYFSRNALDEYFTLIGSTNTVPVKKGVNPELYCTCSQPDLIDATINVFNKVDLSNNYKYCRNCKKEYV